MCTVKELLTVFEQNEASENRIPIKSRIRKNSSELTSCTMSAVASANHKETDKLLFLKSPS